MATTSSLATVQSKRNNRRNPNFELKPQSQLKSWQICVTDWSDWKNASFNGQHNWRTEKTWTQCWSALHWVNANLFTLVLPQFLPLSLFHFFAFSISGSCFLLESFHSDSICSMFLPVMAALCRNLTFVIFHSHHTAQSVLKLEWWSKKFTTAKRKIPFVTRNTSSAQG